MSSSSSSIMSSSSSSTSKRKQNDNRYSYDGSSASAAAAAGGDDDDDAAIAGASSIFHHTTSSNNNHNNNNNNKKGRTRAGCPRGWIVFLIVLILYMIGTTMYQLVTLTIQLSTSSSNSFDYLARISDGARRGRNIIFSSWFASPPDIPNSLSGGIPTIVADKKNNNVKIETNQHSWNDVLIGDDILHKSSTNTSSIVQHDSTTENETATVTAWDNYNHNNQKVITTNSSSAGTGTTAPKSKISSSSSSSSPRFNVAACTRQQQEVMFKDVGWVAKRRDNTNCPRPTWIESYYDNRSSFATRTTGVTTEQENNNHTNQQQPPPSSLLLQQEPFLAINVGCNKGNDAVRLARMGTRNPIFDESKWRKTLFMSTTKRGRGGGRGRIVVQEQQQSSTTTNHFSCLNERTRKDLTLLGGKKDVRRRRRRQGQVHCIEPLPPTYDRVADSSSILGLDKHGFVVTQAVISNTTGSILFPTGTVGLETGSIGTCTTSTTTGTTTSTVVSKMMKNDSCVQVPMYGLDDYVAKFVPPTGPIHVLMIDAEGFDYDIMKGATETLKRVQYLEFEYHKLGSWMIHTVLDAVNELLVDFTCYWAGKSKLWRISQCTSYGKLRRSYHKRSWSNVACVHHSMVELSRVMEETFLETIIMH